MKYFSIIPIVLLLVFSAGCKEKFGVDKIVKIDRELIASDDLYVKYLTDQIDRFPGQEDSYIKLADIYLTQDKTESAIELLTEANKQIPESLEILIHLGSLYLEQEDLPNLSNSLRRIRRINPDHMDFLKLSSGHSLLQRDITNAIFYANRAMLANPYDDENYYLRGSAQLMNNDSINAVSSLEEAYNLKKSYKNFAKYFDVILALKKYDPAKTLLDDYTLKNPEAELCNKQGAYFVATKEWKKAKSILLSCLDLKEDEQQIKLELAKIYYRYNESDSSLHYVNDFLDANPNSTSAMILKAKTLEQISYFTEARKLYNAALEVDSTSSLAIKGLENLDRKVAYLRLKKRKESLQRQVEVLKPLNSKELK